jgi:hypothetical protein
MNIGNTSSYIHTHVNLKDNFHLQFQGSSINTQNDPKPNPVYKLSLLLPVLPTLT